MRGTKSSTRTHSWQYVGSRVRIRETSRKLPNLIIAQKVGSSHVATSEDLEDFALGFSVTEEVAARVGRSQRHVSGTRSGGPRMGCQPRARAFRRFLVRRRVRALHAERVAACVGVEDLAALDARDLRSKQTGCPANNMHARGGLGDVGRPYRSGAGVARRIEQAIPKADSASRNKLNLMLKIPPAQISKTHRDIAIGLHSFPCWTSTLNNYIQIGPSRRSGVSLRNWRTW
jgi:hypothetical protein